MASVRILHGVVSLYGMQIGERAALMFTAICRDLDRVFQRVGLFTSSGSFVATSVRIPTTRWRVAKSEAVRVATGRCYWRNPPTGGSGCPGLRDFPEEIKAIIE